MTDYKELVKQRTSIPGWIEEVERFETWWNKNLATVIAYYDGSYRVFLLVYDSVYSTWSPAKFPTDNSCNWWGEKSRGKHTYLSDARSEANWLREELTYSWRKGYDNPILVIHPDCDCYRSFNTFVTEPYVVKKYSTSYLKPLDVVKTDKTILDHVGVYLGKIDGEFKVCQYTRKKDTTIDPWSDFIEGSVNSYHPIVPFKNYKDISGNIVWAKDNSFRKGNYELGSRNCEHLANMLVYGINYSEQMENNRSKIEVSGGAYIGTVSVAGVAGVASSLALAGPTFGLSLLWGAASVGLATAGSAAVVESSQAINNNKGSTIKLTSEINESNSKLGKKSDWETKKYEEKYLQEVPTKDYNCRIM